ncbi:hypothetical protein HOLDEFILI_03397 [Holdemania filiformis DSM 12042]|uniref:Uncharacterized protein n=1 Tax=Holdemania filiformis DSM 12042 TaxID=545696 RepID=B9YC36_9FIRM|nr:hypothetical protein HOLDEFILI_03397 [Holdemania filiformis DSM 12042]
MNSNLRKILNRKNCDRFHSDFHRQFFKETLNNEKKKRRKILKNNGSEHSE